jgi:hypothetical protein
MSRLLHAAARGARIQTNDRGGWLDAAYIPTADYKGDDFRIHPDDAHLQYGPISTAMREMAKQPKVLAHKVVNLPHFGFTIFVESENELREVLQCDTLTHSLFYLILAECLADEGM